MKNPSCGLDHCVALGIERDDGIPSPVSGVPCPASRVFCSYLLVECTASLQHVAVPKSDAPVEAPGSEADSLDLCHCDDQESTSVQTPVRTVDAGPDPHPHRATILHQVESRIGRKSPGEAWTDMPAAAVSSLSAGQFARGWLAEEGASQESPPNEAREGRDFFQGRVGFALGLSQRHDLGAEGRNSGGARYRTAVQLEHDVGRQPAR